MLPLLFFVLIVVGNTTWLLGLTTHSPLSLSAMAIPMTSLYPTAAMPSGSILAPSLTS
jgi:hypothetical protein